MNACHLAKSCTALVAASILLVACGGGGSDEDPIPTDEPGVLTVTRATFSELNGAYGSGPMNVTKVGKGKPVGKDAPLGTEPELCIFQFDGAQKVGSPAVASGDIRYRTEATVLYKLVLSFDGKEYGSDDPTDTVVVREMDQVRIDRQILFATDGSGSVVRVSGTIPLLPERPVGC